MESRFFEGEKEAFYNSGAAFFFFCQAVLEIKKRLQQDRGLCDRNGQKAEKEIQSWAHRLWEGG